MTVAWRAAVLDRRIAITGELRATDARSLWFTLTALARARDDQLDIDLAGVSAITARPLALVVEVWRTLIARGVRSELVVPDSLRTLVAGFATSRPPHASTPRARQSVLGRIGAACERSLGRVKEPLRFAGELVDGAWHVIRQPKRGNWRSLGSLVERAGADAIVIVLLVDFLVGFVIALQAMPQLEELGASPYVADLVGIAVTRELAPLMTAFIMSGRSGAAYAAELGTMRVRDEIDALETMGISPIPHLVIPRVLALALVAPALVLLGGAAAIVGGLVVAVTSMDLTTQGYLSQLRIAVTASDIWTGQIKVTMFAIAIAIIGCQEGLAARGAAAGVGRKTTATVVVSLFAVIAIDCGLTILFRLVGV
jgi:phospholipid/cholesterol/gamma-HCH transport system permease protein